MPPAAKSTSKPRPVTAAYLRNSAMHYLASRAASATMVRQTLQRRAKRRLAVRSLDADIEILIDKAVVELITLGLIDDAKFAESRAATLVRKGFSRGRIAQGLERQGSRQGGRRKRGRRRNRRVGAGPPLCRTQAARRQPAWGLEP